MATERDDLATFQALVKAGVVDEHYGASSTITVRCRVCNEFRVDRERGTGRRWTIADRRSAVTHVTLAHPDLLLRNHTPASGLEPGGTCRPNPVDRLLPDMRRATDGISEGPPTMPEPDNPGPDPLAEPSEQAKYLALQIRIHEAKVAEAKRHVAAMMIRLDANLTAARTALENGYYPAGLAQYGQHVDSAVGEWMRARETLALLQDIASAGSEG